MKNKLFFSTGQFRFVDLKWFFLILLSLTLNLSCDDKLDWLPESTRIIGDDEIPQVISLSQHIGYPGITLTIVGINFSTNIDENTVLFNGVVAQIVTAEEDQLTVIVPESTTGPVVVTVNGLTADNQPNFTYETVITPIVTSIDPSEGLAGDEVVITGANFGSNPDDIQVMFNGAEAIILAVTETEITVLVPPSTSGPIEVTVKGKTAGSKPYFTFSQIPYLQSMDKAVGLKNTRTAVELYGIGFGNVADNVTVMIAGKEAEITYIEDCEIHIETPIDDSNGGLIEVFINGDPIEFVPLSLDLIDIDKLDRTYLNGLVFTYYEQTCEVDFIVTSVNFYRRTDVSGVVYAEMYNSQIGSKVVEVIDPKPESTTSVDAIFGNADDVTISPTSSDGLTDLMAPGTSEFINININIAFRGLATGYTYFYGYFYILNIGDVDCNVDNNRTAFTYPWSTF